MRIGGKGFWTQFQQIEHTSNPTVGSDRWTVGGVEWIRERHGFWGRGYSIQITVHTLRIAGPRGWTLLAIREIWWGRDRTTAIKSQQWCRVERGMMMDVMRWFEAQSQSKTPMSGGVTHS